MFTVKRYQSDWKKDFAGEDWDSLMAQVSAWLNNKPMLLVAESAPWKNLQTLADIPADSPLIAIPMETLQPSVEKNLMPELTFDTLKHFLSHHETKNNYFLHNAAYQNNLKQEVNLLLHTYQPNAMYTQLLESFITKLDALVKTAEGSAHELLLHQWVLDIMSMYPQLSPSTAQQIKSLSHMVFDTILMGH
jgi:hypothetical protein